MSVAAKKFDRPHATFARGGDLCPNGLLNIFPAAPKTKWGTPFPSRNPTMKYQIRKSSRANFRRDAQSSVISLAGHP